MITLKHLLAVSMLAAGAGTTAFTVAFSSVLSALPESLPGVPYPPGVLTYVEHSGAVVARVLVGGGTPQLLNVHSRNVAAADVSNSHLRRAVLSSEDHTFESHGGLSLLQTAKALLERRGGSTLTQQLSRACIFRDQSRTASRKWREILTAVAVEARHSKDEILESYLNCVFFGSDASGTQLYGAAAAADRLIGVASIGDLTMADAATLAALLNAPSTHLSIARAGRTKPLQDRRNRVLRLMRRNFPQAYSEEMVADAISTPLSIPGATARRTQPATASVQQLVELQWRLDGRPTGETSRVQLTIDMRLQDAAATAINRGLQELERRRQLPEKTLQAALVAMRPDGRLLALVGGRGDTTGTFDRALRARRSPGSLVKPFIQLRAMATGTLRGQPITPATIVSPMMLAPRLRPTHCGPAARVRVMLARSDNCAAVVIGRSVGIAESATVLNDSFGREPERTIPMLLGGARDSETTPLEVAAAYSIFATNGLRAKPTVTEQLVSPSVANGMAPRFERVADEAEAFVVLQMLRSVVGDAEPVRGATAPGAKLLAHMGPSFQLAGKTGTGSRADLWFVTASPRVIVVIWVGTDDNAPLPLAAGWAGATAALPIWADFVSRVMAMNPEVFSGQFQQPRGVTTANVDPNRGCVSHSGVLEYFVDGRLPAPCGAVPDRRAASR